MGLYKPKRNKKSIIKYLNKKFGKKYFIYDFDYINKKSIVRFNCPIVGHGDFSFQVDSIYRSNGCPVCSYNTSKRKRVESVIKKNNELRKVREKNWLSYVKNTHGDLYDYSLVDQ